MTDPPEPATVRPMPRKKPFALQADRKKKLVNVTLSDEERAKLAEMSRRLDVSKSEIVGRLIREAPEDWE